MARLAGEKIRLYTGAGPFIPLGRADTKRSKKTSVAKTPPRRPIKTRIGTAIWISAGTRGPRIPTDTRNLGRLIRAVMSVSRPTCQNPGVLTYGWRTVSLTITNRY